MLAEVLIFVPSVARFREDYLLLRLEKAQIASLALLATDDMIDAGAGGGTAGQCRGVQRRAAARRGAPAGAVLAHPAPIHATYDLRDTPRRGTLIRDAHGALLGDPDNRVIRVIGNPVQEAGLLIESPWKPARCARHARLRAAHPVLSALISVATAALLFLAVRRLLVMPIRAWCAHDRLCRGARGCAPGHRTHRPRDRTARRREALQSMQTQLTAPAPEGTAGATGRAVAKISHDLRNILTTAQLFADRMEGSADPAVARAAPKLVNSISRAVNLCEARWPSARPRNRRRA
jgi:signal transduction histidine kinase